MFRPKELLGFLTMLAANPVPASPELFEFTQIVNR